MQHKHSHHHRKAGADNFDGPPRDDHMHTHGIFIKHHDLFYETLDQHILGIAMLEFTAEMVGEERETKASD